MNERLTLGLLACLGLLFAGCRSKPELVLYQPEEEKVWRTVDREARQAVDNPKVLLETNYGGITIELFPEDAPVSVENFLTYVEEGFYDGTIFHRVIPGFMIQGGGLTSELEPKETREAIENEAGNQLRNLRGTVAMARTDEIDSATSQFFINLVDNPFLNGDGESGGYAVFGRVYEGMQVVDRIALTDTSVRNGMENVPVEPVIIETATLIED